jgi:hypothetical protein
LEVGEHLPSDVADRLVAELSRVADAVLFSAAIPLQGGVGHVNERWQDNWAELFARHGLVPVDVVRPTVWDDRRVQSWYAQNTLLYVPPEQAAALSGHQGMPLRVVHPALYEAQHARRRRPRHVKLAHRVRRATRRLRAH